MTTTPTEIAHPSPHTCRCGATTTREDRPMSEIPDAVEEVRRRVGSFAGEMREKGIHVGINGRCVCGVPWPCSGSDTVPADVEEPTR